MTEVPPALAGRRIGLIGGGAMGDALIAGLLARSLPADALRAGEPDPARRSHLERVRGVAASPDNESAVRDCDVVLLAVKPHHVGEVLARLSHLEPAVRKAPLWISIAAGVSLDTVARGLPEGARVVRAMTNTPAQVGAGATAFVGNSAVGEADRELARALFECVGIAWEAPTEAALDAVTGLSGSGPAYAFVFLEALGDAGVRVGLPRDVAYRFAAQTLLGSARLMLDTNRHPASLKDQVTSPGGTTIAGVAALEARGFRAALHDAVNAATRRSRELGGVD